jgi:hypothetical protein
MKRWLNRSLRLRRNMKMKYLNKKERKGRKEWRGLSAEGRDKRRLIKLMSEFMTIKTLIDVLISEKAFLSNLV